jgi:riboflavin transporter FmnP
VSRFGILNLTYWKLPDGLTCKNRNYTISIAYLMAFLDIGTEVCNIYIHVNNCIFLNLLYFLSCKLRMKIRTGNLINLIVLCCVVLCCGVVWCGVVWCVVLCCVVLCCVVLCCVVLCCMNVKQLFPLFTKWLHTIHR